MCTAELGVKGRGGEGGVPSRIIRGVFVGRAGFNLHFKPGTKKNENWLIFFFSPPVKTIAVSVEPCGLSVRAATEGGGRGG